MNRCLAIVRETGCIVRYPGDFWQKPNIKSQGAPDDSVGTGTIQALVSRDLLIYTSYKNGPSGCFAVTAVFTKRGAEYQPPDEGIIAPKQLGIFED